MISTLLISFFLAGQATDGNLENLVAKLGAARYQERESAAEALERLGSAALPTLIESKDSRDPEIRLRVSGLIERIEGKLLTQPTMVVLDFDDAPITEVVETLGRRAGIQFLLVPEASPLWRTRRVTLRESTPVPFWNAIDRLCEAGLVQYNVGMHVFPQGSGRGFPLYDGQMRATMPSHDSGPFRVSIVGLHHQRNIAFPQVPRLRPQPPQGAVVGPQVTEQCHAQLQVVCEPRLGISQEGPIRIEEAQDDRGQVLADPVVGGAIAQRSSAYSGMAAGSALQLQAVLKRPEQPGRVIKRLRGVIPVQVSTRKPGPVTVKLTGGRALVGRNEEFELTIHELKAQENTRQTMIELSVRPLAGGDAALPAETALRGPNPNQQQIEVVDARERVLAWYQTGFQQESGRITLTLISTGGEVNNPPVEVRYYGLTRASTEIDFDFKDLPMP